MRTIQSTDSYIEVNDSSKDTTYFVDISNYANFCTETTEEGRKRFSEFVVQKGALIKCRGITVLDLTRIAMNSRG